MQKNFEDFSAKDILRLAKSPAGQQLLQLLQSEHGQTMASVQKSAEAGQMQQAQQSLSQLLSDPQAMALLKQLQEEFNG